MSGTSPSDGSIPSPPSKIKLQVPQVEVEFEGAIAELKAQLPALLGTVTQTSNTQVKSDLSNEVDSMLADLAALDAVHTDDVGLETKLSGLASQLSQIGGKTADAVAAAEIAKAAAQLLLARQELGGANQRLDAISNVMKTKHDTVKNSISNIR